MVITNLKQLEVHAETHDQKVWTKEKCWPTIFGAEAGATTPEAKPEAKKEAKKP